MNVRKITPVNAPTVNVDAPTHWELVFDCSGSMYRVMRDMRDLVKTKLPELLKKGDLVSILWFSSKGEWGTLVEAHPISDVTALPKLNAMIDKWLQAMNLTGFVEPLNAIAGLTKKYATPGMVSRLIFMTDGQDNQWRTNEILAAMANAGNSVDDVVLVEFGYYCNHTLLTQMASAVGGSLLFAEGFAEYDGHFSRTLKTRKGSSKRISLPVDDAAFPMGWSVDAGTINLYTAQDHQFLVPEGTTLYYFTDTATNSDETGLYSGLYVAAQTVNTDAVWAMLGKLGDVALINQYATCFSRQDYARFEDAVMLALTDPAQRYTQGKNLNALPAEDAYTVFDLLDLLAGDLGNKFHPYNAGFTYERTSRATVDAASIITDDERNELIAQITAATKPEDLAAIGAALEAMRNGKKSLKFVPNEADPGCSIMALTFNEDRPNCSIQIRIDGTVDLSDAGIFPKSVPTIFPTFIFRNYMMVKDGIKHSSMKALPFSLTEVTFNELVKLGLLTGTWEANQVYLIDADLPVINRRMVHAVKAADVFTQAVQLVQARATQKVFNSLFKAKFERESVGWNYIYGEETVAFLKELGLTEYSGYSPKVVQAEAKDVYTAKTLQIAVAKCSSLPALDKVQEKLSKGAKLTLTEAMMAPAIQRYDAFVASNVYQQSANQDALERAWLEAEKKAITKTVRTLTRAQAQTRLTMIVGHVWFGEFSSLDEGTLVVNVDGTDYTVTATLKDLEIKI